MLAELEKLASCPGGDAGLQHSDWPAQAVGATFTAGSRALEVAGLSDEELGDALPLARFAWRFDGAALGQLKASRKLQQRCGRLRHWAECLGQPLSEAAMLQLCRELEEDLPALVLLQPSATHGWLLRWRDRSDPLFHPRSPLGGRTLQRELAYPRPAAGEADRTADAGARFGRPIA